MLYRPSDIESKWQKIWQEEKTFCVTNDLDELKKKPKYYVLDMFPYPSAAGLHVGHPEGYTATDVVARYKRLKGFNVLHPMGWDAFGLPAERAAVRENIHPAKITQNNINNFRRQIKKLGFSYDWDREICTSDSQYYKWTQWIFLQLYKKGLAYLAEVKVNWCPKLGTVLANEEVKDGRYVETGDPVERRLMKQWVLKITSYAQRLLDDLDEVDWPEGVKEMQRNWIGKSYGAEVDFKIDDTDQNLTVFTTRADTLFGASYCVVAPEHDLAKQLLKGEYKERALDYINEAKNKSDLDRTELNKDKTGVFTGSYAINPVNGCKIPIWIADYILANYGTGAVMAVPAHDERDHQFAVKHELNIIQVIKPTSGDVNVEKEAFSSDDGILINSDFLDGLGISDAQEKVIDFLQRNNYGKKRVNYRLRDWLFSRQRYWGEPFPVIHRSDGSIDVLNEKDLPVMLPIVDEFKPTVDGQPPLARADKQWREVKLPNDEIALRETNTMPQWAGSCWYYLRFIDANNDQAPFDSNLEKYWMPVDLYIGGVEHAVLHLLYARFWHKVLYDCGFVHTKEPFQKLFNQGMILGTSYQDDSGKYYYPEEIEQKDNKYCVKANGKSVKSKIEKMSKSKFNVVSPDDVIDQYGADAMRLYELFMGPLEQVKPWQMSGVEGVYRFLQKLWRLLIDEQSGQMTSKIKDVADDSDLQLTKLIHKTIKKVQSDIEHLRFNTAISQMMIFLNEALTKEVLPIGIIKKFLLVVCPFAPHIAEELWHRLGCETLISKESWPEFNEKYCQDDLVNIVIQINGKKKAQISASVNMSKKDLIKQAMSEPVVKKTIDDKVVKRTIVVPKRLINIVL